jgi:hypothetical protein
MFSSKGPRPNSDPKPWSCTSCGDRFVREQGVHAPTSHITKFRPRAKFDHAQHNEPNPILVFFREYASDRMPRMSDLARATLASLDDLLVADDASPEQVDHARKVLARLAKGV